MFWGGVVARSPLTQATGTPYDDAWRAINRLMVERSVAGHQRNVFLRNDGQGGFDDVSGAVGLDLDQDGRAFAVLDFDGDGDPDLVLLAPRSAPQLRLFRNDFKERGATLAVRLVGAPSPRPATGVASNRDAIGARVTVETDRLRRTKVVQAGSGFLSQHSKELLFGLGASQRVVRLTVEWPSGRTQVVHRRPPEPPAPDRGGRRAPGGALPGAAGAAGGRRPPEPASPPSTSWLFEPFPAPDFSLQDLRGEERSLSALRGTARRRPALGDRGARRRARPSSRSPRGATPSPRPGSARSPSPLDPPEDLAKVRAAAAGVTTVPVLVASRGGRSRLRDPQPSPLHEPAGPAAADGVPPRRGGAGRQGVPRAGGRLRDPAGRAEDRGLSGRASRAGPALRGDLLLRAGPARLRSLRPGPARPGPRGAGGRRLRAGGAGKPERVDPLPPGEPAREDRPDGQGEGRLRAGPGAAARPVRGQQRPRHAPGGGRGHPGGDRAVPGGPRRDTRLPRRPQQPGLRAPPDGPGAGGPRALREGPEAPARFPRGPEQPRPHPGTRRATWTARSPTSARRCRSAPATARPRTTWPSSSSTAASPTTRSASCRGSSRRTRRPRARTSRWRRSTWPRIAGARGWRSLERLLQRNPTHPLALEIVRQFR